MGTNLHFSEINLKRGEDLDLIASVRLVPRDSGRQVGKFISELSHQMSLNGAQHPGIRIEREGVAILTYPDSKTPTGESLTFSNGEFYLNGEHYSGRVVSRRFERRLTDEQAMNLASLLRNSGPDDIGIIDELTKGKVYDFLSHFIKHYY